LQDAAMARRSSAMVSIILDTCPPVGRTRQKARCRSYSTAPRRWGAGWLFLRDLGALASLAVHCSPARRRDYLQGIGAMVRPPSNADEADTPGGGQAPALRPARHPDPWAKAPIRLV